MICAACGHENSPRNRFCTSCGSRIAPLVEPGDGVGERGVSAAWLKSEVTRLRSEIDRLATMVEQRAIEPGPAASPKPEPTAPVQPAPPVSPATPRAPVEPIQPAPPRVEYTDAESPVLVAADESFEWEPRVGARWLAWVGVVALIIGSAFFLRLAYDNGWIQQTGLVVLGVVFGLVLIGLGEFWHNRYPGYAATLAGGGSGIIYVSLFAAHTPFDLIPLPSALSGLLLVSVLLAAIGVRYVSLSLAVIAVGGAYLAPLSLMGVGDTESARLWSVLYLLAVGAGVLYLSTMHDWRGIVAIGFGGTVLGYLRWVDEVQLVTGEGTQQFWLTAMFLLWIGGSLLHHYVRRIEPDGLDIALSVFNAVFFALVSYTILWTPYRDWMGASTLALGVFYAGVGYALHQRSDQNRSLAYAMGVMAVVISALAVPIELSGPWVVAVWFAASLALMAASAVRSDSVVEVRIAGLGMLAAATAWLLLVDVVRARDLGIDPVFNRYVLSFVTGAVAAYGAAAIIRKYPSQALSRFALTDTESVSGLVMLGSGFLALGVWTQIPEQWLALAWGVEAGILGAISFGIMVPEIRRTVYVLVVLAGVRALAFESYVDADGYTVFWNERSLAFVPVIVTTTAIGLALHRRLRGVFEWESTFVAPVAAVVCNGLLLWYLSAEVIGAISSGAIDVPERNEENVISLSLSVLWAGYAAVGLLLGVVKNWKRVRAAALLVLAVPVVKLFVYDTFELESGYRVAAFLTLGFLLVAGGYLYQRYESAVRGFLFDTEDDDRTGARSRPA